MNVRPVITQHTQRAIQRRERECVETPRPVCPHCFNYPALPEEGETSGRAKCGHCEGTFLWRAYSAARYDTGAI